MLTWVRSMHSDDPMPILEKEELTRACCFCCWLNTRLFACVAHHKRREQTLS